MYLVDVLRSNLYAGVALDSSATSVTDRKDVVLDAASVTMAGIAQDAIAAIQAWGDQDVDLDGGESLADRLFSLFVGIADSNKDGELSDDEMTVIEEALEVAADYLASLGVDPDDIDLLLNDWDEDAADRTHEMVISSLPDGEEAAFDSAMTFVYGGSEALDSTYVNRVAVRGGKKVHIKKRMSGSVRLSARQKLAIRKMQLKAHSPVAKARRLKSMNVRRKIGI